jgi:Domain of unknown function (DUF6475)
MQPSEKDECLKLVSAILDYYKQPLSPFVLAVWWEGCKIYSLDQVSKALTRHATDPEHGQFAPKVADIVKQLSGTVTDRSAIAWGKVFSAMSSVGAYTDVVFDDPAIHAAIEDLGGWPKVCRGETKDLGYLMHRFCEFYKAYAAKADEPYPKCLMGDRSPVYEYEKKGLPLPTLKFIGNPEKANAVMQGGVAGGKTMITDSRSHFEKLLAIMP